jgi:uncharacterized delta-60 repeat protein
MSSPVRSFVASLVLTLLAVGASPASASPGVLDPLFGGDGTVTAYLKGGRGAAVAIDPKGRIVVVGTALDGHVDVAVERFLPNGKPDAAFGGDGRVRINMRGDEYGLDLALTDGGGIAVAGRRMTPSQDRAIVVRLFPSGRRDTDFGGGDGAVAVDLRQRYQGANALAFAPNGSLVVGGFASNGLGGRLALFRLGQGGGLDRGFGHNGIARTDLSDGAEQVNDLLVLDGGKIVVAGSAEVGIAPRFLVARYRRSGRLDARFGRRRGFTSIDVGSGAESAEAIARQPNGKLVLAGSASGGKDWGVARVGFNGALDKEFGEAGVRAVSFSRRGAEAAAGVVIQPDGRIVLSGRAKGHGVDLAVVRLLSHGRRDRRFGRKGLAVADVSRGTDLGAAVALQANGKIVVAGETWKAGLPRFLVARFLA